MPKTRRPKRSRRFSLWLVISAFLVIIALVVSRSQGLINQFFAPAEIDYIGSTPTKLATNKCHLAMVCNEAGECSEEKVCIDSPIQSPLPTGCYYQAVKCIRAPCEPILVCPSPVPAPAASCVPLPTCPEGMMCAQALPPLPDGQVYCSDSPQPTKVPSTCLQQVESIAFSASCKNNDFATISYSCSGGARHTLPYKRCYQPPEAYQAVADICCRGDLTY